MKDTTILSITFIVAVVTLAIFVHWGFGLIMLFISIKDKTDDISV